MACTRLGFGVLTVFGIGGRLISAFRESGLWLYPAAKTALQCVVENFTPNRCRAPSLRDIAPISLIDLHLPGAARSRPAKRDVTSAAVSGMAC